jgi:hypothetical protein
MGVFWYFALGSCGGAPGGAGGVDPIVTKFYTYSAK